MGGHLLPDLTSLEADDVEVFLRDLGEVFVVHRGHDSNNTSAGVEIDGRRWFVKWATDPEAVSHLESAVRFHTLVSHPAIAALRGWFTFPSGLALVHNWVTGEVLNDPLAPDGLPRQDPRSAFTRFRCLGLPETLAATSTIFDVHLAAARRGFVAVDFYDGCLIYDFARRAVRLCDLDSYRPGPYILDRDRQYGSTRFMAPEEFRRGAQIDQRTTVFTLGRAAFVLLSDGPRGEQPMARQRPALPSRPDRDPRRTRPALPVSRRPVPFMAISSQPMTAIRPTPSSACAGPPTPSAPGTPARRTPHK